MCLGPLLVYELGWLYCALGLYPGAIALRMLGHHHGVGAARHRRAGHDLDALSVPNFAAISLPRAHFARYFRPSGKIGGMDRESVANGAWSGRIVAIRQSFLGQHATSGGLQRHFFALE